jgi:PKD repeat protein
MTKGSWLIGLVLVWGSMGAAYGVVPTAIFSIQSIGNGQYQFVDESTGEPTSWEWNFGDGNFSDEQHPLHTYLLDGIYLVCLTVANDDGEDKICQALSVSAPPLTAFSYESIGLGGIAFTDESQNEPTAWEWDFGDGTTNPSQNPIRIYTSPGDYTVCLTAANDVGANTHCDTVSVLLTAAGEAAPESAPVLFPNPASTEVFIQWPSSKQHLQLAVFRSDGRFFHLYTPANGRRIPIDQWPTGAYWYALVNSAGHWIQSGVFQIQR